MGKMFLMSGLSGVGKTTYAKEFARKYGYCYLSIDDIYSSKYNGVYNEETGFNAWIDFFQLIHKCEKAGFDVVIDTNSPTTVKRDQFIDWFPSFSSYYLIYIDAPRGLRIQNNKRRKRVVPDEEITQMEKEFEVPSSRKWYIHKVTNYSNSFSPEDFILH